MTPTTPTTADTAEIAEWLGPQIGAREGRIPCGLVPQDCLNFFVSSGSPGVWLEIGKTQDPPECGGQVLLSYVHAARLRDWLSAVLARAEGRA